MSGDLKTIIACLLVGAAACASPAEAPVPFAFVQPAPNDVVVRDVLSAQGEVVAPIHVELSAPAAVDHVALWAEGIGGNILLATLSGDELEVDVEIARHGPLRLHAIAFDGADDEIEDTEVVIEIQPGAETCVEWLDLYQLDFYEGSTEPGIVDPVTVFIPINGLSYRYLEAQDPRPAFLMDCEMGLTLASAAPYLRSRGIVEVLDLGLYNYRCIGGGTPPDCPNGISQHAYGTAIDMAAFLAGDGTIYSVLEHWNIDAVPTCEAEPTEPEDVFLHEVACDLKANFFNIVLTPNYNSAHANHFHLDLTPDADFIRWDRGGVDEGPDYH